MTILEQFRQNIQQRNEAFEKMTMMERRVAVAKDVLAMIEQEMFEARTDNGYVCSKTNTTAVQAETGEQLQPAVLNWLHDNQGTCEVCAKGAFFLAKVSGYNHAVSAQVNPNLGVLAMCVENGMADIFDDETYEAIEDYFENAEDEEYDEEGNYINPGPSNLRAICYNIIENNGEFTLRC